MSLQEGVLMENLKSCPFCGSDKIEVKYWLEPMGQYFFMKCDYCLAFGPRALQMLNNCAITEAKNLWNDRK